MKNRELSFGVIIHRVILSSGGLFLRGTRPADFQRVARSENCQTDFVHRHGLLLHRHRHGFVFLLEKSLQKLQRAVPILIVVAVQEILYEKLYTEVVLLENFNYLLFTEGTKNSAALHINVVFVGQNISEAMVVVHQSLLIGVDLGSLWL